VPVFLRQREAGTITITDERMTRFWLSLEEGVRFVISCIEQMEGGEVFIPKIPSMKVLDLARAVAPSAAIRTIGIRPGEKLHEVLIAEDEARHAVEMESMFVIQPAEAIWFGYSWQSRGKPLDDGFRYSSDNNANWLDLPGIQRLVAPFEQLYAAGKLEA
jgi:UDP-N-acetylglucosamine 4,6-dehydratase